MIEAWTCRKPSTEKGVPGMSLCEGTPEAMAPSPQQAVKSESDAASVLLLNIRRSQTVQQTPHMSIHVLNNVK